MHRVRLMAVERSQPLKIPMQEALGKGALRASARLNDYLRAYFPFPGIAQVARLVRAARTKGKATTETVYLITALTPAPGRSRSPARAHPRPPARRPATGCAT